MCPVKWPVEELVNHEMKAKLKGEMRGSVEDLVEVTKMCQHAKCFQLASLTSEHGR